MDLFIETTGEGEESVSLACCFEDQRVLFFFLVFGHNCDHDVSEMSVMLIKPMGVYETIKRHADGKKQ